ncbi:DUF2493 domain-containing protein [Christensenellaceae bacterium OttesenSCG-928-L17]|nr:DUF2493 domain-containing protein [Christensenellaceae bacterium OttesenSCG-928-L17]
MKVAIVGSRNVRVNMADYVPKETSEIITGGARGIDTLAEIYAREHHIPLRVFYPDVKMLGKRAYFARNDQIVDAAELIVAIWDGKSAGTKYTIRRAMQLDKPVKIYIIKSPDGGAYDAGN